METGEITVLLRAWGAGDQSVTDRLFESIYAELRNLAQHHLAARSRETISPTVLIHEAFLQLTASTKTDWRDRVQFYAFAATVMRRLIVAYARSRGADKRGGGVEFISFDESIHAFIGRGVDTIELNDALTRLEKLDAPQARIVELRFFGGLSVEETAEYLGISARTVTRQWGFAKAWLAIQLAAPGSEQR